MEDLKTSSGSWDIVNLHFSVSESEVKKLLFSGFWVTFTVETHVGPIELLLLYLLMMLGPLESFWLLRSKHFYVSCLVEIWENKRIIRQQSSQQNDPWMKKQMGTKKENRETLSCLIPHPKTRPTNQITQEPLAG